MLIDVSVWAMVAVFVELIAGRGGWVFARRRSPRVVCLRVDGGSDGVCSCLSGGCLAGLPWSQIADSSDCLPSRLSDKSSECVCASDRGKMRKSKVL
jgi:hypothetical protein